MNSFWVDKLKLLVQKDLNLTNVIREKDNFEDEYHPDLEKLHIRNAKTLEKLIEKNGFPVLSNSGEEGVKLAWMVIQHAISLPDFIRSSLDQMRFAAAQRDYPLELLAYTEDLVAYLEGRGQIYGTHMEWRNGEYVPSQVSDPQYLEHRRKSFGLTNLEDQNMTYPLERPPKDPEKKLENFIKWKKRVGWQSGDG
jgi:hypothetical protein